MPEITISAPAKVNYLLDVINRRADGYHNLRMIMQRINLCDTISLSTSKKPGISVACNAKNTPNGPENIAWKAARALLDVAGSDLGVSISITKNIPVAAGLGGGSSDAASVLMGLNEIAALGLSDQQLMEIGCKLGADVPFFVYKQTALAEGIGEIFTPFSTMPSCYILLINTGIHVSTAWVYRSLQLTKAKELTKLPEFFDSIEQVVSIMSNDLETVTIPAYPIIAELKAKLLHNGAIASMMSGSGPTVFGVFTDYDVAENARIAITSGTSWFSATVVTL